MSRYLTALERYRLTGTTDPCEQLQYLRKQGIAAVGRSPRGGRVIECVVYLHEVRRRVSEEEWRRIRDEHTGSHPLFQPLRAMVPKGA